MVTLQNRSKQMHSFNLDHDVYCANAGECRCVEMTRLVYEPVPGMNTLAPREDKRLYPTSLIIPSGYKVDANEAVLKLEAVMKAKAQGWLSVIYESPSPAPASDGSRKKSTKE